MLKFLEGIIRALIENWLTPAAIVASQILRTIIPVMDCFVGSQ